MYTIQEFNQLKAENIALADKVLELETKIKRMEREQRAINKQRNAIDKYYNKRVKQVLSLLSCGMLNTSQISGITGFSSYQITAIERDNK